MAKKKVGTNFKLLICSPSNSGCDEITRRIKEIKHKQVLKVDQKKDIMIVRLGRTDNMHKDGEEFNLDVLSRRRFEELMTKKQCEKSKSLQEFYTTFITKENNYIKKRNALKASNQPNLNQVIFANNKNIYKNVKKKKKFFSAYRSKK